MEPTDPPSSSEEMAEPIRIMSDTQIHKAQLEHKRNYHRKYYHEHKTTSTCPHCGKDYSSVSSLRRHQGRSPKCMLLQGEKEINELRSKLASNVA